MRHFCTVLVVAAALAVASAGPAGACLPIDLGLNGSLPSSGPTQAAGPGDTVGFTISGTEAGAEYVLTIGGQVVAIGSDGDGGGLASSFTMPDLGVAQTVLVEAIITHEGESWPMSGSLDFKRPGGSSGAPPPTPGPEGSGSPQPPTHTAAEPAATSDAPVPTASANTANVPRSASKPAVARPSQAPRPEPQRFLSLADAHPVESASAVSVEAAPVAARRTTASPEIPWYPLTLAALGLLIGGGGAAGFVLVRRRRPGEPHDPIEAELQEIIAEERAKQMLMRAP